MRFNLFIIVGLLLLKSPTLLAAFGAITLSSSTHDTSTASNATSISLSWSAPTVTDSTVLNGYYYKLNQESTTLMTNSDTNLSSSTASKTVTASSGDGDYYFHLAAFASNGDISATAHFGPIKIDTTAPSIPVLSPDGGSFTSTQNVSMSSTDVNNAKIYYSTDNTDPSSSSTLYSSAISVTSTKTIKAIAIDTAGNSSAIKSSAFTINSTTNVAQFGSEVSNGDTVASNSNGNTTTVVSSISVTGSSVTKYKHKVDSGSFSAETNKSTPIDISTLSDGSHTISIVGNDGVSWQADSAATTLTFTIDNTAPSDPSFSTVSGATLTSNTTITITSTGSSNIYYTSDNSTPSDSSTNSSSKTLSSSDNGTVILKAIAYDSIGNKSNVVTASYTVDISSSTSTGTTTTTTGTSTGTTTTTTDTTTTDTTTTDTTTTDTTTTDTTTSTETTTETTTDQINTGLTITGTPTVVNATDGSKITTISFTSSEGESIEVEVVTKITNALTVVNSDGSRTTTTSETSESGESITTEVKVNNNGTVENKMIVGDKTSSINVAIVGTDSTINEDSSITMTIPAVTTDDGKQVDIEITADKTGEIRLTLKVDNKVTVLPTFEVGSLVEIKNENGKVTIEVQATLTKEITFR